MVTWLLGFGLVALLGLRGGGFDLLVYGRVGIAVWWLIALATLVGALPRQRPGALALLALAALAALAAWTAIGLSWTESADKTSAELARAATYLGVFALALLARERRRAGRMTAAVGAGVAAVAAVALLSRLHPSWFPEAMQTADILSGGQGRLSYPLHYWNALAALAAIGLPPLLATAAHAGSAARRGLAAAALPALALTVYFTLSRGGVAAALIALAVLAVLAPRRLALLPPLLLSGAGAGALIVAVERREALREGLTGAVASRQGDEVLALTLLVCALAGLLQGVLSRALERRRESGERQPGRRRSSRGRRLAVAASVVAAALVAGATLGAPGRASDAWEEFKRAESPEAGSQRLGSVAGQGRYQLWAAATRQFESQPLRGTGAGTYEYWWARDGDDSGTVLDAHSLYLQTLGEQGAVGAGLLAAFLLAILLGGGTATLRAGRERSPLAAAIAGCAAFCLSVGFDWHWQIPAVPVAFLLLASLPVTASNTGGAGREGPPRLPLLRRAGIALAALAAIAAIAVPLAAAELLRESRDEARAGDLTGALRAARTAENVQPHTAAPRLQQALVLERLGALAAAAEEARAATRREPTSWRTWLILARVEAGRGRAAAAVQAYRRARSLNPHHILFEG